ncbi:MAG: hypothetical protein ABIG28_01595 [archaeon]
MKKTLILLLLIILLSNIAQASYFSGEIKIDERGSARFNVETDIPVAIQDTTFQSNQITGKTEALTSKKGSVWTFSLNLTEYNSILLDIKLPKNLNSINIIEGNEHIIDTRDNIINIMDNGQLDFKVSYTLKESYNYAWLVWLIIFLLIFLSYYFYNKRKKKKERINNILPLVNENEEKIIDVLMKSPAPLRQKELRKQLNIPKASFTRYLINLEKKKLILREGDGKNKIVRLK